jgi:hypothetical protein
MKLRFSDRIGLTKPKAELLKEGLSPEMVNTIWTLIHEMLLEAKSNEVVPYSGEKYSDLTKIFRKLWINFFKRPIDNLPTSYGQVNASAAKRTLRDWFFEQAQWHEQLNLLEFLFDDEDKKFQEICNDFLKNEYSAYRFIDGVLTEINSKEEIVEIESALNISDKFKPVKTHLSSALHLLSDKKKPDYRNSIKESISAVESFCKIILGNDNTTLGKALSQIEKKHAIPVSLKNAFSSLYGYTSEEGGIRHALLEKGTTVDLDEARFMLITCSAFINYLMTKI